MNQKLRPRTFESHKPEEVKEEIYEKTKSNSTMKEENLKPILDTRFIHSTKFKWSIILTLFLTTALGTYRSFSIYSEFNPHKPIHQITSIPTSSLISTQNFNLKKSLPYFAQKSNLFNQKFVKLGWAWTSFVVWFHSIALASFYFGPTITNHQQDPSPSDNHTPVHPSTHVPRIITLHLVASTLWIFLTQWFFGSSLIERVLILSGAKCIASSNVESLLQSHSNQKSNLLENIYCEQRWGKKLPGLDPLTITTYRPYWSGGIDVSGHSFLLSFSILVIISALQPSLVHIFKKEGATENIPTSYKLAIYANLGLLTLWWWMLLMTSLYFHGPTEKLSGLALGVGSWFLVESIVDKLSN